VQITPRSVEGLEALAEALLSQPLAQLVHFSQPSLRLLPQSWF